MRTGWRSWRSPVRRLNRDLWRSGAADGDARAALAPEAKEAAGDMAVFARVLEATRANLDVMNRLRELRTGRLEYRAALEYGRSRMAASGERAWGQLTPHSASCRRRWTPIRRR